MRKEITGESLNSFTTNYLKTDRYETEKQLGERYGLDKSSLYEFFQKSGRLYDGAIKDYLFRPKENLQFGPVVYANKTLYFYKNYWNSVFTDDQHTGVLKELVKTNDSLKQAFNITPEETPKVISKKPYWRIDKLRTYFRVSPTGQLIVKTASDWKLVNNSKNKIRKDHNCYLIRSLIVALNRGTDYVNIEDSIKDEDLIPPPSALEVIEVETTNSKLNIPNNEYDCYVFAAYKLDGTAEVVYSIKNTMHLNALLKLMPAI